MILGAGKSGTTTLADYLALHEEVCMSVPKEPWFFDTSDFRNGIGWYAKRYFSNCAAGQIRGEASSQSLFVPYVPRRIWEYFPHVRLVAILRDPAERAYADWWMKYASGEEDKDFESAVAQDIARMERGVDFSDEKDWQIHIDHLRRGQVRHGVYVDYGFYAQQLERYLEIFRGDRIKVLLFDDLVTDPESALSSVARFVGVSSPLPVQPESPIWSNAAVGPKLARLRRLNHRYGRLIPPFLRSTVRTTASNLFGREKKPPMPEQVRKLLIARYSEDIARLEALLGRDLTEWKK